jgi:hypothetical protein
MSGKGGRHSEFSAEIADLICERIADGESLRAICGDPEMPGKATVFRWLAENATFRDQYARAREAQADGEVDEIVDIADGEDGDGDVQRDRLRVDARKWRAAKMAPKKYGDSSTINHRGAVGVFDPAKHSTDELRTLLAILEPAAVSGGDGEGDQGGAETQG